MWTFIRTYLITFSVFLAIDLVWLGFVAKDLYRRELGFLMADGTNWIAALAFYAIFILGMIVFVINPALIKGSWKYALLMGLFFGFITYSTYDLTNLATLKDWPIKITMIDLMWGTSLGGLVSTISFFIINWLG